MRDMASMFTASQQDSLNRGQVLRGTFVSAISSSAQGAVAVTAQVPHLTGAVTVLHEQLNTNFDFLWMLYSKCARSSVQK